MKTGNRRRRKLNRLAKARALRARCQAYLHSALIEAVMWSTDGSVGAHPFALAFKLLDKAA